MSDDRTRNRARVYLVLSIVGCVLGLVSLALAIADPGWLAWLRVAVWVCVTTSLYLAYRQRRTR